MRILHLAVLPLLGLLALAPTPAAAATPRQVATDQTSVELIAARTADGEAWLGLRFVMNDRWHIYWRNPGDSGGPPTVTWGLPAGVTASEFEWPAPSRLPFGPLMNYGYQREIVLPVQLKLPGGRVGAIPITASVRWLVCREVCVSGKATLAITLNQAGAGAQPADWARQIAAARSAVPKPMPSTWRAQVVAGDRDFTLSVRTGVH